MSLFRNPMAVPIGTQKAYCIAFAMLVGLRRIANPTYIDKESCLSLVIPQGLKRLQFPRSHRQHQSKVPTLTQW